MMKNKKGFTIVELVVVIAVIAILAAVLFPIFSNVVSNAQQSAAVSECREAYLEAYLKAIESGELDTENTYSSGLFTFKFKTNGDTEFVEYDPSGKYADYSYKVIAGMPYAEKK